MFNKIVVVVVDNIVALALALVVALVVGMVVDMVVDMHFVVDNICYFCYPSLLLIKLFV
jgi:hypothetical protein